MPFAAAASGQGETEGKETEREALQLGEVHSDSESQIGDVSAGPLARPLTRSLAPLTRLLAPHCSLCSRAPLRSLFRSLAHSLTPELMHRKEVYFYELNASNFF